MKWRQPNRIVLAASYSYPPYNCHKNHQQRKDDERKERKRSWKFGTRKRDYERERHLPKSAKGEFLGRWEFRGFLTRGKGLEESDLVFLFLALPEADEEVAVVEWEGYSKAMARLCERGDRLPQEGRRKPRKRAGQKIERIEQGFWMFSFRFTANKPTYRLRLLGLSRIWFAMNWVW